ncbi:MAG: hypothetical protein SF162_13795 [bacterium]|nr:hypothetical protein [bacterium]
MFDLFHAGLSDWQVTTSGSGTVQANDGLRLTVQPNGSAAHYHNAQIADYTYQDFRFRWHAPLTLTVIAGRAGVIPPHTGTAGFGFWNHPLSPELRRRLPRLPAAIWFFYGAPPHDLRLALDVPGHGWKAQTIDAARPQALALAPIAPLLMLLMRVPPLYRPIYRRVQRILKVGEAALDPGLLADRHTYTITWARDRARFTVDGAVVLETPFAPAGALGFIAWADNQVMVATPQGHFRWGIAPLHTPQTLVIESLRIERDS